MLKEAIEKIVELGQPYDKTYDGRTYTSKPVHAVLDPSPTALHIVTLTGLVDYIKTNVDELYPSGLIIHIANFQLVNLLAGLNKKWANRNQYIRVECDSLKFPFGQFMDVESFIIRMQSQFVEDENTAAILRIVGNVSDSVIKQFSDDGVTQQATVKAGISRVENVAVPNPVTLAPYRTFLEIEQPVSKFVFRMRTGDVAPTCALFESDGGNWKNEAIQGIKEWLTGRVGGIAIIA
jgi:hypothetical protein